MKKTLLIALTSALALALAACGSSDGGTVAGPAPSTDLPAPALQNSAGLLEFANQQIAGTNDTDEPVIVGEAALPLDDTTETSL